MSILFSPTPSIVWKVIGALHRRQSGSLKNGERLASIVPPAALMTLRLTAGGALKPWPELVRQDYKPLAVNKFPRHLLREEYTIFG
jgi:hypothetical protein